MPFLFKKENDVLINKKLFLLQNFLIFCLLVDFYNSIKYAKFQHRSPVNGVFVDVSNLLASRKNPRTVNSLYKYGTLTPSHKSGKK